MKNILILLLLFTGIVNGQIVNIPNANFKLYLAQTNCVDTNNDGTFDSDVDLNNDSEIQVSEALSVTSLKLTNYNSQNLIIIDATGIQAFSNLNILIVEGTSLSTIDFIGLSSLLELTITQNQSLFNINFTGLSNLNKLSIARFPSTTLNLTPLTNLNTLFCEVNDSLTNLILTGLSNLVSIDVNRNSFLSTLDVSNLPNLQILKCDKNYLDTLIFNNTPSLTKLNCKENRLITLDFSNPTNLTEIDCSVNPLTSILLTGLGQLQKLTCKNNLLTSLNASSLTNLITLDCSYNDLTTINVAGLTNLTDLNCTDNNITAIDLTGMSGLLKLQCFNNQLTTIDLSQVTQLTSLNCSGNQFSALNVSMLTNLTNLGCGNNQLTALDVTALTGLISLVIFNTQISSIDLSTLVNLTGLGIGWNPLLTSLDVSNQVNLTSLSCNDNNLTSLDVSQNPLLTQLQCSVNQLSSLDISNLTLLQYVDAGNNLLTTLDISNSPNLSNFDINNSPNLTYLNLKNGNPYTSPHALSCPNLVYVCEDEALISQTLSSLLSQNSGNQIVVTSYCSFNPGGDYNTITGAIRYDCDFSAFANPYLKVNINDGTNSGSTFTNTTGNYTFYTQSGNFNVTPELENPNYFNFSPPSAIINFPVVDNSTQTQNFCITANGVHPDLEVTFVPMGNARPGFDTNYKIVYKNKGNQTLSGNIKLSYDSNKLNFVATFPNDNFELNTDEILWNYSTIQPLETRSINLTLNVNAPPTVNNGDILNFTTTINPILADETPLDNVFVLNQTVVNSFDPNQIECLEGSTITPEEVGNYLHYNINFENIGTADAINIVVKDTINTAKFNINSLQLQYASHDVETKVSGNIVEFIFKNIHLQPSIGGPIGGHGNVLFKIKTLPNLIIGDEVMGSASIFFDYNAPIATNEERTLIASLSKDDFIKDETVTVAPNPTRNTITVASKNKLKSVMLFDVQGRLLQTILEYNKTTTLDISNQANGIYFLKVVTEIGSSVEKIVKEN